MTDDRPGNLLACPNCLSAEHIGENVSGWREIHSARLIDGKLNVDRAHFATVEDAEHESFFCSGPRCNVDEEIPWRRMVQLDHEGNPLPAIHPAQERLA
jgi:hypothetical protein